MNSIDFAIIPNHNFDEKYEKRILGLYTSIVNRGSEETINILFDYIFVT